MQQDVHSHIREIELRLSGILAGEARAIVPRSEENRTELRTRVVTAEGDFEHKRASFRSALPQAVALAVIIVLLGISIAYLQWQTSATYVKATAAEHSAMEARSQVSE